MKLELAEVVGVWSGRMNGSSGSKPTLVEVIVVGRSDRRYAAMQRKSSCATRIVVGFVFSNKAGDRRAYWSTMELVKVNRDSFERRCSSKMHV